MPNVMYERDAMRKWCPFSIVSQRETSTTGSGLSTAVSVNRGIDLDNKCLGAGCMAWRWVDESRRIGYCGLAASTGAPTVQSDAAGGGVAHESLVAELESTAGALASEEVDAGVEFENRICGLCARMIARDDVPEGYDGYCPIFDVFTKNSFRCDPNDDHWTPAEGICGSCKHLRIGSISDEYDGFCEKIGGYVRFTDKCPTGLWQKGVPTRAE